MGEPISPALIDDYERHVIDLEDRVNNLAADLLEARAQLAETTRLRDNAVERLNLAMSALVATGYFTAYQVSEDVAPRIWELHRALAGQLDEAHFDVSNLNVALEAAEFDRDEARHARDEYAIALDKALAEVERLRREGKS